MDNELDAEVSELSLHLDEFDDSNAEIEASKCSAKEWAFAQEFVIDMNGCQSVLRCGCYSAKTANTANQIAHVLLRRTHVQAAIVLLRAQRAARVQMTQDNVISELALLSHSNIAHYYVDDEGNVKLTDGAPEGAMRAIKQIKRKKTVKEDREGNVYVTYDVELQLWDKPGPLKLMGKHLGLFPDKVELTGKDGAPLHAVDLGSLTDEELAQRAEEAASKAKTLLM